MCQSALGLPAFGQNSIEGTQCESACIHHVEHARRLQVCRNAQRVPANINRFVHIRRGTLQPRVVHFLLRRLDQLPHPVCRNPEPLGDLFLRSPDIQNVLCWIVVHLANFVDVVVEAGDLRLLVGKYFLRFGQSPSEVVAVILHGVVGVLRGVKPAPFAIAEPLVYPANDVAGHLGEELGTGGLAGMHVILQQFRIVIGHLLEVRHHPALVDRVAMKAPSKLVVNAATRHLLERRDKNVAHLVVSCAHVIVNQEIEHCGMRKFRSLAKTAVLGIEHAQRRLYDCIHNARPELSAPARK